MNRIVLAGVAAFAIAGSTVAFAQQYRPWFQERMHASPEDRAAFADARIAAVHAGLKLTPDQEKLWPPVEAAVRDFAKMRIDRANARMNAGPDDAQKADDPVTRLRDRADRMATSAAAMKKIADAADPLYKSLDDGQKRRLALLTHWEHGSRREGWRHRDRDRSDDGDRGRGYNRDYGRDGGGRDHGGRGGPERL